MKRILSIAVALFIGSSLHAREDRVLLCIMAEQGIIRIEQYPLASLLVQRVPALLPMPQTHCLCIIDMTGRSTQINSMQTTPDGMVNISVREGKKDKEYTLDWQRIFVDQETEIRSCCNARIEYRARDNQTPQSIIRIDDEYNGALELTFSRRIDEFIAIVVNTPETLDDATLGIINKRLAIKLGLLQLTNPTSDDSTRSGEIELGANEPVVETIESTPAQTEQDTTAALEESSGTIWSNAYNTVGGFGAAVIDLLLQGYHYSNQQLSDFAQYVAQFIALRR